MSVLVARGGDAFDGSVLMGFSTEARHVDDQIVASRYEFKGESAAFICAKARR